MCKNSCSTIVNQVLVLLLPCIPDGYKYTLLVHVLVNVYTYAVQWPCLFITYGFEAIG